MFVGGITFLGFVVLLSLEFDWACSFSCWSLSDDATDTSVGGVGDESKRVLGFVVEPTEWAVFA